MARCRNCRIENAVRESVHHPLEVPAYRYTISIVEFEMNPAIEALPVLWSPVTRYSFAQFVLCIPARKGFRNRSASRGRGVRAWQNRVRPRVRFGARDATLD